MAFLDDIGKKISQAGQTAVQKTKDMTEVARLSGLISEEEKALNNLYGQIGRMYVTKHPSDFDSDFAGMIQSVTESENRINTYKQQIQDIKGVVRCPNCGNGCPMNAAFCNTCGTPLPKPVPVGVITCSGCGAMLPPGTRFCTNCGKPLTEPDPEASAAPQEPIEIKQICPNCNTALLQDAVFCTECGTKVN